MQVKSQPYLPFYPLCILLLFFTFLKKGQKIYLIIPPFLFYSLWMIIFLFCRKNLSKNQMLFLVATTLFHFYSISLDLWLNMENQNFSIFLDQLKTLTPFLWIFLRKTHLTTKEYLEIPWIHFWQHIYFYTNKVR